MTWAATGWSVSLAVVQGQGVTATAGADVGPSPYFIQIFAESDRTDDGTMFGSERLAACGSGTTCVAGTPPAGVTLVAFVSSYGTTLPPVNAQAASVVIPSPTVIG